MLGAVKGEKIKNQVKSNGVQCFCFAPALASARRSALLWLLGSPLHCGGSGRKSPQGERDGSRSFGCLHTDVQSAEPGR